MDPRNVQPKVPEPIRLNSRPKQTDFSLPSDFDFDQHKLDLKRAETIQWVVFLNLGVALSAVLHLWRDAGLEVGEAVWSAIFAFTGLALFNGWSLCHAFLLRGMGLRETSDNVLEFQAAQADWDYRNKRTGEGFWRALRGRALEDAAGLLFRDAGWRVQTTPVTGDGGIDLVMTSQNETYNCQCKGYAKPVSVAAVREIAGVCSTGNSKPMLIVVNGVTRPAREEAIRLSVKIMDSRDLAVFAKQL